MPIIHKFLADTVALSVYAHRALIYLDKDVRLEIDRDSWYLSKISNRRSLENSLN